MTWTHNLSEDTYKRAKARAAEKLRETWTYRHPGYHKDYPIQTVLRDLASQEHCDGEPYDVMIAAAAEIDRLQALLKKDV